MLGDGLSDDALEGALEVEVGNASRLGEFGDGRWIVETLFQQARRAENGGVKGGFGGGFHGEDSRLEDGRQQT